jgi:hypothetical protein
VVVTYQDVVRANGALAAWALVEPSGATFAPYIGGTSLTASGIVTYQDTGPFVPSFGVKESVGGKIHLPFILTVAPPVTNECWIKLSALPVTTYELLIRAGSTGGNGNGFYVDPAANHLIYTSTTTGAIDTGFVWPDTNWHLFTWSSSSGSVISAYVDGSIVWRQGVTLPTAPSPNNIGYGCDANTDSSKNVVSVAYPAFYPLELTPSSAYATFLAATDPGAALAYVTNAAGAGLQQVETQLQLVLGYVAKVFQNAP